MAVGIVSVALLMILSLVPVGLQSVADSGQINTEADIVNTLTSEMESVPFDRLDDYVNTSGRFPAWFDLEGNELSSASKAVFEVDCLLEASTNSEADWFGQSRRGVFFIAFRKDLPASLDPSADPDPMISEIPFLLAKKN